MGGRRRPVAERADRVLPLRALFRRGLDPIDRAYEFPLLEEGKPPADRSPTARRGKSPGRGRPKGWRPPSDGVVAHFRPSPNHPHV